MGVNSRFPNSRGLTLIELLIGLVIVGVLAALVAPAFNDMVLRQRVRGVNAQLVTDLQFARAEAAARSQWARIRFRSNATQTCYTIFTSTMNSKRCDCLLGAGSACTDAATREVRTQSVPNSTGVFVGVPTGQATAFAFDHIAGGIVSIPTDDSSSALGSYTVNVYADTSRALRNVLNQSGRVTVCAPAGSAMQESAC